MYTKVRFDEKYFSWLGEMLGDIKSVIDVPFSHFLETGISFGRCAIEILQFHFV